MPLDTLARAPECSDDPWGEPLHQGDVFQWKDTRPIEEGSFGIIITADCDLAHAKNRGILSYVPIMTLADYLTVYFLPAKIEKILKMKNTELLAAINRYKSEQFPEDLTMQSALEWVAHSSPEQIMDHLAFPDIKARRNFEVLVNLIKNAVNAYSCQKYNDALDSLVALRTRQGVSHSAALAKIGTELSDHVANLPGDLFFLGKLSSTNDCGFVAQLRFVREMTSSQVAIRMPDLKLEGVMALRISRLNSPYIYRLTQQVGEVFSSIGLSKDYEDCRNHIVKRHHGSWSSRFSSQESTHG